MALATQFNWKALTGMINQEITIVFAPPYFNDSTNRDSVTSWFSEDWAL